MRITREIAREAPNWEQRVQALEAEGLTRSDAQAVVDAEDQRKRCTCDKPQLHCPLHDTQF